MNRAGPEVAVTGSTGALGGLVARGLAARGVDQLLVVRDPGRAPDLGDRAPIARCAYDDPVAAETLAGVKVLFMVSAAESVDRLAQHRTFIDSATRAGVEHIVYTSFFGAAPDCTFTLGRDHWATEEHIRASGVGYTFLRDNFYLEILPSFIGDDGVMRGPAGQGRVSAVSRVDIAEVALVVLADPQAHLGRSYDLTGPEAFTLAEACGRIRAVTGRSARFQHQSLQEAYASRLAWPAEQWQYDAWVTTYLAMAAGEVDGVCDDVPRLLGRPARSLTDVLALEPPRQVLR